MSDPRPKLRFGERDWVLLDDYDALRTSLRQALDLLRPTLGYIDDVPDGRAQHKDKVRAFVLAQGQP